jgi:hypothetical protein
MATQLSLLPKRYCAARVKIDEAGTLKVTLVQPLTQPLITLGIILKVICKWKNKYWSIKRCLFYPQNKMVHCLNSYPKHVTIFLILQTFNRLPRLKLKRWFKTYREWNTFINASFSKMQSLLVNRLPFRSYNHLFVTLTAISIPLFCGWRCGNRPHWSKKLQRQRCWNTYVLNVNPGNQDSPIILWIMHIF